MNDITTLSEAYGSPVKKGTRWLVTVARPGQGASGYYTEDVLRETGPDAIRPKTKAFFKHARPEDRDVRDMVGIYEEGAFWNEEAGELQAYLTPFPRYQQVLEEAGDNIEASIRVASRKDPKTGYVKELIYDRANTVDLVAFGGLEGSRLQYQVESLFAKASAESEQEKNKKENNVDLEKAVENLTSAVSALSAKFDTFVAESKEEMQGTADAEAVETLVATRVEEALANLEVAEKAIEEADIFDFHKESLKSAARKGEDITDALAEAVSFTAEARKELAPEGNSEKRGKVVVVSESLGSETKDFSVGRWSKK